MSKLEAKSFMHHITATFEFTLLELRIQVLCNSYERQQYSLGTYKKGDEWDPPPRIAAHARRPFKAPRE